jgi:hypothetical protein
MGKRSFLYGLALLCLATSAQAQIDSSRMINWSSVGVPGGIPNRTTICSTLNPGATASQINSAIAACPSGQVVMLNAGTYSLSTGIAFNNKSNVTVRGAGADQTFLVFTGANSCHGTAANVCMDSADTNYFGGPSNTANWTAGYARGSTVLTLSSTSNLAVGTPITLDQTDDSSDGGDVYVCESSVCTSLGDGPSGATRSNRVQQQIVTVTAINGSQVSISPGIYMPNWRSSQSPQAWWSSSPIRNSGIENLSLDHTSSSETSGVEFFNCYGCWVKGIRSIDPARNHVMLFQSNHSTVRDSYFYQSKSHYTESYGIESYGASDVLIENNIFQAVTAPRTINAPCSGCVVSYNYSINDIFSQSATWFSHSDFLHSGGVDFVLFEGNVGEGLYSDEFHGTHHFITVFRNRYIGYELNNGTATNSNTIPMILYPYSRFYNVIGNVLGSTARPHTQYQYVNGGSNQDQSIYQIGSDGGSGGIPNDSNVLRTLMRWGNYDVVNGGTRFVSSEVPSGIANFANALPTSQALPASLYLPGKPGWWPSGKPWPAIGPDVTGGNISNVGGFAYSNAAQDCYTNMGGNANGTGGVLSFSAATCYGTGSTNPPPSAPTNLRVVAP